MTLRCLLVNELAGDKYNFINIQNFPRIAGFSLGPRRLISIAEDVAVKKADRVYEEKKTVQDYYYALRLNIIGLISDSRRCSI